MARELFTVALLAGLAGTACEKAPAEPGRAAATSTPTSPVAPLVWDAPPAWAKLDVSGSEPAKARYRVPPAASDKEDAEAGVFFFGTGSAGDAPHAFKQWFDAFDGDVGSTAVRESFEAHGSKVDTVEIAGTYKVPLTPTPRGRKAAPVQMVKAKWRLYGGVVRTPDRGNWFFRLAGPDDTVQATRAQLRAMMESAR